MSQDQSSPARTPPPAVAPAPPSEAKLAQLGQFQIVRKIGQGGMGAVFLAQQVSLNRPVAIKLLPDSLAENKAFVDRFHREARAAAALSHPNLIQVYDAGEQDGQHYFAMEFVEGEAISQKIEREGPMTEHTAVAVAMCVAAALHHAWTKARLIHRDIKPDNIMLTPEGTVKLCDLGLAKSAGRDSRLTMAGMVMGTPQYVAPEQARGDPEIDTRADIYSLGATLFHMVTGQPPFHADSAMAIMFKHVNEPLPDPRQLRPGTSDGFVRVLEKMTAKNPADRYQDMLQLYNDLERLYQGLSPTVVSFPTGRSGVIRTPETPEQLALRSLRRGLWFWRIVGGIGLVAIALVVLSVWQMQKRRAAMAAREPMTQSPPATNMAVAPLAPVPPPELPPAAKGRPGPLLKRRPEMMAKVLETLKQQQEENERRAEAQRKAEADAERQRVEARARSAARLKAEEEYRSFVKVWAPLLVARDYAQAESVARNAAKDAALEPIQARMESHITMSQRLAAFQQSFRAALPGLKDKTLTYGGMTGKVSAVDSKSLTIDMVAGVGRAFPLTALRTDEWLTLAFAAMGQNNPEVLVDAGLVSLAENHPDWAKQYFDRARFLDQTKEGAAKAAAQRFDELRETLGRVPMETAAAAALDELQELVTDSKWQDAAAKLSLISKQFADTTTIQHSTERLQDIHDAIIAAETGPEELRAQLTLNKLREDVEKKEWRHASQMLKLLAQRFAGSDAVQSANDLPELRDLVAASAPAGTSVLEPGARDRVAARKGATIHKPEPGSRGKPGSASFHNAVTEAKEGDGIELDAGIYFCKGLRSSLKNLNIFGKPGALPIIIVPPGRQGGEGIELTNPAARWRFENVMFTSGGPMADNATLACPVVLHRGASAEFQQCLFAVAAETGRAAALVRCGPGSEAVVRNCLFVRGRAVEAQQPRRVRLDHCTLAGAPAIWLTGGKPAGPPPEVMIANSLVITDAPQGWIGGVAAGSDTNALTAVESAQLADLRGAHHNVIVLEHADALEAWKQVLEKSSRGPNYLALSSDQPPLVVFGAKHQSDFHLLPDCPASHAAADGQAVGVRWPEGMWDLLRANYQFLMAGKPGKGAGEKPQR